MLGPLPNFGPDRDWTHIGPPDYDIALCGEIATIDDGPFQGTEPNVCPDCFRVWSMLR